MIVLSAVCLWGCSTPDGSLNEVYKKYPNSKQVVQIYNYHFVVIDSTNTIWKLYCGNSTNDEITTEVKIGVIKPEIVYIEVDTNHSKL